MKQVSLESILDDIFKTEYVCKSCKVIIINHKILKRHLKDTGHKNYLKRLAQHNNDKVSKE